MSSQVDRLGNLASWMRRFGASTMLARASDLVDNACQRSGFLPLRVKLPTHTVRGFLRHRSFLSGIQHGRYEPFLTELFRNVARSATVVVDAGAHIGHYTMLAAHEVNPDVPIFAFEPDPYNLMALEANARGVDASGVIRIVRAAVAGESGSRIFFKSPNTISGALVRRPEMRATEATPVSVIRLDDLLIGTDLSHLVVKLDVEGSEVEAIRGAHRVLDESERVDMFVEINPRALEAAGTSPRSLIDALRSVGLRLNWIDETQMALDELPRDIDMKMMVYARRR